MGASAAAGFGFIEETGVGVASKQHVAGAVSDAVVGVGGDVVEELVNGRAGGFSGGSLLGAYGAEGDEELIVDGAAVPEEGANNALDTFDASVIEWGAGVWWGRMLDLGPILDGGVLVRGQLGFGRGGVAVLGEHILDVAIHGETARALGVVPRKVDTGVLLALPVFRDGVVLLKDGTEVQSVAFSDVFDAKVIDDEGECDGAPLVTP